MQVVSGTPIDAGQPRAGQEASPAEHGDAGFARMLESRQAAQQARGNADTRDSRVTTHQPPNASVETPAGKDDEPETAITEPADAVPLADALPAAIMTAPAAITSALADSVRDLTARSRALADGATARLDAKEPEAGAPGTATRSGPLVPEAGIMPNAGKRAADRSLRPEAESGNQRAPGNTVGASSGQAPASGHEADSVINGLATIATFASTTPGESRFNPVPVAVAQTRPNAAALPAPTMNDAPVRGMRAAAPDGSRAQAVPHDATPGENLPGNGVDSIQVRAAPGGVPGNAAAEAPAPAGISAGLAPSPTIVSDTSAPTAMSAAPPSGSAPLPGIPVPLGSPQWGDAFSRQMVMLGSRGAGTQHIEMRLDPPQLGPLHVTLSLQGEQAHAIFTSPHVAVRQAIEAALPQLQQALAEAGISLGDASVGEHGEHQDGRAPAARGGAPENHDEPGDGPVAMPTVPRGLVDTFA